MYMVHVSRCGGLEALLRLAVLAVSVTHVSLVRVDVAMKGCGCNVTGLFHWKPTPGIHLLFLNQPPDCDWNGMGTWRLEWELGTGMNCSLLF